MAATSHPTATFAAVEALRDGGNAVDAAVAACAVQCVVEAGSTGIGGDCFALLSRGGTADVIAYNGSGRTPAAATTEWYERHGVDSIERHSPHAVTIPRRGTVTLPREERDISRPLGMSGRCDRGLPRGHRRSAKRAVRLG